MTAWREAKANVKGLKKSGEIVMQLLPRSFKLGALALALIVTAGLPTPARASAEPVFIGPSGLLLEEYLPNKKVREELRLKEDQVKKLEALLQEYRTARQEVQDKQLEGQKERTARQELEAQFNRKLSGVLGPGQQKRLRQIYLQAIHVLAWEDEQVRKELALSKEQIAKVQQIVDETRKKANEAAEEAIRKRAGQFDPSPIFATGMKRIANVLTDDQRVGWEVMLGRPFRRQ
jgi:hypothetical protein